MSDTLSTATRPEPAVQTARSLLHEAIEQRAILRRGNQLLVRANGQPLDWLMDLRVTMNEGEALDAIAELFWREHEQFMPFQVGGMEIAAVPLVSAILMKGVALGLPINGFIVRKERKLYGAGNVIEGQLSEHPIILVDDLLNSGDSLEKVMAVLGAFGRRASRIFVVMDFESRKGKQWRSFRDIKVTSLFKLSEFGLSVDPVPIHREIIIRNNIFDEVWVHKPQWVNFFNRVPKAFPTTDGECVYFGTDNGTFWALDAADGSVRWKFQVHTRGLKNLFSAPALHNGRVFFGGYDGNVYCLDTRTGAVVWSFGEADAVGSSPALAPDLGLLFIGLDFSLEGRRGSIIALDMETGERVWEHRTRRYTHASPAYWPERKLVACGSNDDEMFLFDAETGHVRWRFQTRGEGRKGSIRHAPAFDTKRGHLITGSADGYIYVIDVETGKEVWCVKTDNEIYSVPLVAGDQAFIGSTDRHFYVLDLDARNLVHKFFTGSKIYSPPRQIGEFVYFGGCDGVLRQYDPQRRAVVGRHQLPDGLTNAIAFDDLTGLFYALTYTNSLHAMRMREEVKVGRSTGADLIQESCAV